MRHPFLISFLAATVAHLLACVPPLPASSLGESGESPDGAAGSAATSGAAATGGAAAAGGAGGSTITGPTAAGGTTGPGPSGRGGTGGPSTDELTFVADAGNPASLAVNESYLCWGDNVRRSLMKVAVDGSTGPIAVVNPLVAGTLGLAVDAQSVYATDVMGETIILFKVALAGGPAVMLETDPGLFKFAVNSGGVYGKNVFWIVGNSIYRAPK